MADLEDFELDEETLRQIEAEAAAEVDAEFELDEDTLKLIEEAALEDADLADLEIDDDFLAEVMSSEELGDLDLDDLDLDDLDLDDIDLDDLDLDIEPEPATAPEPVAAEAEEMKVRVVEDEEDEGNETAILEAKRQAYERAKKQALQKRKKVTVARARKAAHLRKQIQGHAQEVKAIEKEMVKKQGSMATIGVVAGVIILFAVLGIIALVVSNMDSEPAAASPKKVYKQGGSVVTGPQPTEATDRQKALREFNRINGKARDIQKGRGASGENIRQLIADIAALRTNYPDFTAKRQEKINSLETKLQGWLAMYEDAGGGSTEDEIN